METSLTSLDVLVAGLTLGKRVGPHVYLHASAIPAGLAPWVRRAADAAGVDVSVCNVVKFGASSISLLRYPRLLVVGFPELEESWKVSLPSAEVSHRVYTDNRPVLHRKELLLRDDHPCRVEFEALTLAAEHAGLFRDPSIIGHAVQWTEELRAKGLAVRGHRLVQWEPGADEELAYVPRHKTAIRRNGLSTPMQALWRHGFLDGTRSVLDYGCGRGDDLATLEELGVRSWGWDPHFRPDGRLTDAEVVNLGFVLNVIEDPVERQEALRRAFSLSSELLVVAVLVGGRTAHERQRLVRDGVLTRIGTFQKYFDQEELALYLEEVLGTAGLAMGPGLFFVFKDASQLQQFELRRAAMSGRQAGREPPGRRPSKPRTARVPSRWETHEELLEEFWACCLRLGRAPEAGEFDRLDEVRLSLGTPGRVLGHLKRREGLRVWRRAQADRRDDLLVFLALSSFKGRLTFSALPKPIQRDVRRLFGPLRTAEALARSLLFKAGDLEILLEAAAVAVEAGLGHLDADGCLWLHPSLVPSLPVELRLFTGCAELLFGELSAVDLIGLRVNEMQVVAQTYPDFEDQPVPLLESDFAIDLRRGRVWRRRRAEGSPLYLKSRFLHPSHPRYAEQRALDQQLVDEELVHPDGQGPSWAGFRRILRSWGLELVGFDLREGLAAEKQV